VTVRRAREGFKRNAPLVMFMTVLAVIAFILIQTKAQSKRNGKVAEDNKKLAEQVKTLVEERKTNDLERTNLLMQVRSQAEAIKAQGDRIEALANGQTVILEQVKVISQQVPNCFMPQGQCTKAAQASAANLKAQLDRVLITVQSFQFAVTGKVEQGTFTGTAKPTAGTSPAPCQDTIGVGNQAVLPGVLCTKP
jgi:preprotein translocase subunit YajC